MMNLSYHEDRIDRSLIILYGKRELPAIRELIKITTGQDSGVYKYSMVYSNTDFKVSIGLYQKRNIIQLLLLEKPDMLYNLKYADRSVFGNLLSPRDINTEIIFTRAGLLTDTRYTNIALEKDGLWITPEKPLLEGTQRALLLDRSIIIPGNISRDDLKDFSKIRLFNAMMPWEDVLELDISKIKDHD